MIQKLEILDETLDMLDEINNNKFSYQKFKEVNSHIEKILVELKTYQQELKKNKYPNDFVNILHNILYKIDKLETKILPKANLLDSFSNSKS